MNRVIDRGIIMNHTRLAESRKKKIRELLTLGVRLLGGIDLFLKLYEFLVVFLQSLLIDLGSSGIQIEITCLLVPLCCLGVTFGEHTSELKTDLVDEGFQIVLGTLTIRDDNLKHGKVSLETCLHKTFDFLELSVHKDFLIRGVQTWDAPIGEMGCSAYRGYGRVNYSHKLLSSLEPRREAVDVTG
jgi:hypothetical protein